MSYVEEVSLAIGRKQEFNPYHHLVLRNYYIYLLFYDGTFVTRYIFAAPKLNSTLKPTIQFYKITVVLMYY